MDYPPDYRQFIICVSLVPQILYFSPSQNFSQLKKKPVILIAPLDWGLGHASRMVPLIRRLSEMPVTIILAADGDAGLFLAGFFPGLPLVKLPSRKIRYPFLLPAWLGILIQAPLIITGIFRENRLLGKLVHDMGVTHLISDNRFGLWNRNCRTAYITHQLAVRLPVWAGFMQYILYRLHIRLIKKFNHCWIPDYPDEPTLSGELTFRFALPPNVSFTGPLSHLSVTKTRSPAANSGHVLILLSGPEPQRSVLENLILKQLKRRPEQEKYIMVRGIPGGSTHETKVYPSNLQVHDFLTSPELGKIISGSRTVICRAGYSSIMDLVTCGKQAVLIPTPGQTEQEYLASRLTEMGAFYSMKQKTFCLDTALAEYEKYSPEIFSNRKSPDLSLLLNEFLSY